MAGVLGDLQDFIDWAYALYVDLNDRLNALEDDDPDDEETSRSIYKPLKLKFAESIISTTSFATGAGWKLFGAGAAEFGRLLLKGTTTVTGTIDFTKANVIGLRGGGAGTEIVFSQPADVEGLTSPPWAPASSVVLRTLRVLCSSGPSGSLTVDVLVNGSPAGSVTLGSGSTDGSSSLSIAVSPSDIVQVSASAGSGAIGLTAIVRYS